MEHRAKRAKITIASLVGLVLMAFLLLRAPLWTRGSEILGGRTLAPSSVILDRHGRELYEMIDPHTGLHHPADLEDIPLILRQAVIATEDASFYENPGFSPRAIVRALWTNFRHGRIVSGGSTITQQVARNVMLSPEARYRRDWRRKVHETAIALWMTCSLGKERILALYLNETYFGNMAYGVEAAARAYFGKPVAQLDLAECAMLAGLPQSPANYNPLTNLQAAKKRQKDVLSLMVKAGYITTAQAERAHQEPLQFASEPLQIEAPHFCMMVRERLGEVLEPAALERGGLRIHTTLDLSLQHAAEAHLRRHLEALNHETSETPSHNVHNGAIVVMDPDTGHIRVLVGSPDYFDAKTSGAVNAALSLRQPGSAIKPLTYAAAFEQGYSPATPIADVRTTYITAENEPYTPINYDYKYHGLVSLRQALACSYNAATVRLLDEIGTDQLFGMARRLGITTLSESRSHGLALTLGSGEVNLLELTAAYAAFANGGQRIEPRIINYVEDADGHILYQSTIHAHPALDERIAYLITDILADEYARIPTFGEGSVLELSFPAAAKTGTTTNWRDNWTVGYSSEFAVGVWVGNANNEPMERVSGVSGAAPVWNATMRSVHRQQPAPFVRPDGIAEVEVCALSGLLPNPTCQNRKTEVFLKENAPSERCAMHRLVPLDGDGAPAEINDAGGGHTEQSVTLWPPEILAWAQEEGRDLSGASQEGSTWPSMAEGAASPSATEGREHREAAPLYLTNPTPNGRYAIAKEIPVAYQQLEVSAFAPSSGDLQEASLFVDGQQWHTWTRPPYRVLWPLTEGEHTFHVRALAHDGSIIRSAARRITVLPAEGK
ncbi:MAG: PBP1A family penicillin-binding protein [Chloroflexota bacterium]|nr:PBP1A family penicillin-binding protein [Chloroflexota bacterium]